MSNPCAISDSIKLSPPPPPMVLHEAFWCKYTTCGFKAQGYSTVLCHTDQPYSTTIGMTMAPLASAAGFRARAAVV